MPPKILLFDASNPEAYRLVLQRLGYSAKIVHGMNEVTDELQTCKYDLAILDLCDSSVELAAHDALRFPCKILFLTCDRQVHGLLLPNDYKAVLSKPIELEALKNMLGEILGEKGHPAPVVGDDQKSQQVKWKPPSDAPSALGKFFGILAALAVTGVFGVAAYILAGWGMLVALVMVVIAGLILSYDFGVRVIVPVLKIAGTAGAVIWLVRSLLPLKSVGEFVFALLLSAFVIFLASCVFDHEWLSHG